MCYHNAVSSNDIRFFRWIGKQFTNGIDIKVVSVGPLILTSQIYIYILSQSMFFEWFKSAIPF